jgi:hypothetical protein
MTSNGQVSLEYYTLQMIGLQTQRCGTMLNISCTCNCPSVRTTVGATEYHHELGILLLNAYRLGKSHVPVQLG